MPQEPLRARVQSGKFEIGEIAVIRNLSGDDSIWNGAECVIASNAYLHPDHDKIVINVIIAGDGNWALEPWNLKRVENRYDGNHPASWNHCVWKPKGLKHG